MQLPKPKKSDIKILSDFFKILPKALKIKSPDDLNKFEFKRFNGQISGYFDVAGKFDLNLFFADWVKKIDGRWRRVVWNAEANSVNGSATPIGFKYTYKFPDKVGWYWLKRVYYNKTVSYKPVGIRILDSIVYVNFWGAEWQEIDTFVREQKDLVKLQWAGPFFNPE